MKKKIILIMVIVLSIIVGGGLYFLYQQSKTEVKITGKTNNFDNVHLVEVAKQYILKKPQLLLGEGKGDKLVQWNEVGSDFSKTNPGWITSQKVSIKYVEPNKYQPPNNDLNGKYLVSWFFIPGCKENSESSARPNWFRFGMQCVVGYDLTVIINPDGTVDHARVDGLK